MSILSCLSKIHFEEAINRDFNGLVRNWIMRLVFVRRRHLVDADQLANDVLNDFIEQLNNRMDDAVLVRENSIRLCRTITRCHVNNALVFVDRKKRKAECVEIGTTLDVTEHSNYGPESIAINRETRQLILAVLGSQLRQVVVFKLSGWDNCEIAIETNISIRAIERMLKKVEPKLTAIILNTNQPKSQIQAIHNNDA